MCVSEDVWVGVHGEVVVVVVQVAMQKVLSGWLDGGGGEL